MDLPHHEQGRFAVETASCGAGMVEQGPARGLVGKPEQVAPERLGRQDQGAVAVAADIPAQLRVVVQHDGGD